MKEYTPIVVTLWYRAPELLLQTKQYSYAIDNWSIGCIFGELITMQPLFQGKSEIDQLNIIFSELGTPTQRIWPGYPDFPIVKNAFLVDQPFNILYNRVGKKLGKTGFHLINRFLTYCPERRITAEKALSHDFFDESPKPVDPALFPTWPAKSEGGQLMRTASSPKAPSGGKQYAKEEMYDDYDNKIFSKPVDDSNGFHMNISSNSKKRFNLRF